MTAVGMISQTSEDCQVPGTSSLNKDTTLPYILCMHIIYSLVYYSNSFRPPQNQPNQKQPDQKQPNQEQPDQKQPNQEQPDQKQPNQEQPNQKQLLHLFDDDEQLSLFLLPPCFHPRNGSFHVSPCL